MTDKAGTWTYGALTALTGRATLAAVFTPLQDLASVFSADNTYVFTVKMNYWLGL